MRKKEKRTIKRSGVFHVYILRCSDNTLYTGYTADLRRRVLTHQAGKGAKYTRTRLPVKLVWFKEYKRFKIAFMKELSIKRLNRKQKEELIKDFARVKRKRERRHTASG